MWVQASQIVFVKLYTVVLENRDFSEDKIPIPTNRHCYRGISVRNANGASVDGPFVTRLKGARLYRGDFSRISPAAAAAPPPFRMFRLRKFHLSRITWGALTTAPMALASPRGCRVTPRISGFSPQRPIYRGRPQAASGTISEFLTAPSPHWVLFPSPIFFSIGLSGSPKTFTTSPFSWRHLWITPSNDLQFFQKEIPVDLKGALLRETFSGKFLSVCCFPCEIYVCESL